MEYERSMPSSVALLLNTESVHLCLSMNGLCRAAGIDCTITEMHADCLYLAGKGTSLNACSLSIFSRKRVLYQPKACIKTKANMLWPSIRAVHGHDQKLVHSWDMRLVQALAQKLNTGQFNSMSTT